MIRRFIVGLVAFSIVFLPGVASGQNQKDQLSPAATATFSDVARCLTSGKSTSLSVFYLVDTSGSLTWTDPLNERQKILAGSIGELSNFVEQGIDVELSVHLFSSKTQELLDWTSIAAESDATDLAVEVGEWIDNDYASGYTDWEQGLELAYRELNSRVDSCKMLIWFTDGGINPSSVPDLAKIDQSLANLCKPGVGSNGLGAGSEYQLMSEFRKSQIAVFGVLYSNLEAAYSHYVEKDPESAESNLVREKWLMSFMQPLLEGRGEVSGAALPDGNLPSGTLQCAELQADGTAPFGQYNGAFLNASDPVALAYQFLKLSTQISGGTSNEIVNGKFTVPSGTAKFTVLVAGQEWKLEGPQDSGIVASPSLPSTAVTPRSSAGASAIEVLTAGNPGAFGEWSLESFGSNSELFLYPGLTFVLDRDKSSKILSDYPNSITGKITRTSEFAGYPVELANYSRSTLTVLYAKDGLWLELDGPEISLQGGGEFAISNLVPPEDADHVDLRLRLDLGREFLPVESDFNLQVQDKAALATVLNDDIRLSTLRGPSGVATGTLNLIGPSIAEDSVFCFAESLRLDDAQTGIEKVKRESNFEWKFIDLETSESGTCFTLKKDELRTIEVQVSNAIQAPSQITAVWGIVSTTEGVDTTFEAPIRFSFDSAVETNQAVTWGVLTLLLLIGIGLPLGAMSLLNLITTRFIDIENTARATFPVKISRDGSGPLLGDARAEVTQQWALGPKDFAYVQDEKSPRSYQTGRGEAFARVPIFPLSSTWYEWRAPEGSRVFTHYAASSKKTSQFANFEAVEISPNMAENWALVVKDTELAKVKSEPIFGDLVVFASVAGLGAYEAKLRKILSSSRLKTDLELASGLAQAPDPSAAKSSVKNASENNSPSSPETVSELPPVPGFMGKSRSSATSSAADNLPPAPSNPGSTGGAQKLPWEK